MSSISTTSPTCSYLGASNIPDETRGIVSDPNNTQLRVTDAGIQEQKVAIQAQNVDENPRVKVPAKSLLDRIISVYNPDDSKTYFIKYVKQLAKEGKNIIKNYIVYHGYRNESEYPNVVNKELLNDLKNRVLQAEQIIESKIIENDDLLSIENVQENQEAYDLLTDFLNKLDGFSKELILEFDKSTGKSFEKYIQKNDNVAEGVLYSWIQNRKVDILYNLGCSTEAYMLMKHNREIFPSTASSEFMNVSQDIVKCKNCTKFEDSITLEDIIHKSKLCQKKIVEEKKLSPINFISDKKKNIFYITGEFFKIILTNTPLQEDDFIHHENDGILQKKTISLFYSFRETISDPNISVALQIISYLKKVISTVKYNDNFKRLILLLATINNEEFIIKLNETVNKLISRRLISLQPQEKELQYKNFNSIFEGHGIAEEDTKLWFDNFINGKYICLICLFKLLKPSACISFVSWYQNCENYKSENKQVAIKSSKQLKCTKKELCELMDIFKNYDHLITLSIDSSKLPRFLIRYIIDSSHQRSLTYSLGMLGHFKDMKLAESSLRFLEPNPIAKMFFLTIVHHQSSELLLEDLDILETIKDSFGKNNSCLYMIVSITSYMLKYCNDITECQRKRLFIKAIKNYNKIAELENTNKPYLYAAELRESIVTKSDNTDIYLEISNYELILADYRKLCSKEKNGSLLKELAVAKIEELSLKKNSLESIAQQLKGNNTKAKNNKKTLKISSTKKNDKQKSSSVLESDNQTAEFINVNAMIKWRQTFCNPQLTQAAMAGSTDDTTLQDKANFFNGYAKILPGIKGVEDYNNILQILCNLHYKKLFSSIDNDEFKANIITTTTVNNDLIRLLRINQNAAFYHSVQVKAWLTNKIDNHTLKLMYKPNNKNITIEKSCIIEGYQLACNALNLVWNKNLTVDDFRTKLTSLKTEDYIHMPQELRKVLASLLSTLDHLAYVEDIINDIPYSKRTCGLLFDLADKVNPLRHKDKYF